MLKQILKKMIRNHDQRRKIHNWVDKCKLYANIKFALQIKKRKRLALEDYLTLSQPLAPLTQGEYCCANSSYYGIPRQLRRYANYKAKINAYVEHGVYFGGSVEPISAQYASKYIITFGDYRAREISKAGKIPICIGPYIHYAEDIFSEEEKDQLKQKYGRCLLVFPSHSIETSTSHFNVDELLKEIKQLSADFDTVLVSVFWADIMRGQAEPYLKEGYRVVTSGHRSDPYFLSRLRTLFELADVTASNDLGAHVGYSIFMGKPHWFLSQEVKKEEESIQHLSGDALLQAQNWARARAECRKLFSEKTWSISPAQKQFCNEYWGFDCIRSPQELHQVLAQTQKGSHGRS